LHSFIGKNMLEVTISDKMLIDARKKAGELGRLNNSIQRGAGNLVGFLGEYVAQKVIGGRLKNTYDYDLLTKDGIKIDVKTKQTSVAPKDYYDCSIASYNIKQDCDYYAFVRIKNDFSVGWFLGWIKKEDYFKKARELKKGEKDGDNNFVVKADCFNLKINELNQYES
jgi:hypothetical protein